MKRKTCVVFIAYWNQLVHRISPNFRKNIRIKPNTWFSFRLASFLIILSFLSLVFAIPALVTGQCSCIRRVVCGEDANITRLWGMYCDEAYQAAAEQGTDLKQTDCRFEVTCRPSVGSNLLKNSDFTRGADEWVLSSHDYFVSGPTGSRSVLHLTKTGNLSQIVDLSNKFLPAGTEVTLLVDLRNQVNPESLHTLCISELGGSDTKDFNLIAGRECRTVKTTCVWAAFSISYRKKLNQSLLKVEVCCVSELSGLCVTNVSLIVDKIES